MDIVNERTHRVLAYVGALNRHGVKPDYEWVEQFARSPERKYDRVGAPSGLRAAAMILAGGGGERVVPAETFVEYMERLGWVEVEKADGKTALTLIGRALLRALNAPVLEESATDVFEVVLDPSNPFAYAQALGGLSASSDALLVEPYFRLDQLMDIAEFDNITRVLLGSKLKRQEYEVLATGLASLEPGRTLEVRKAAELHDRYLIPSEGSVLMLGASLGGIGRKVSTMTTLGDVASQALRDAHEKIWTTAEVIEPKTPPAPAEHENTPPAKKTTAKKTTTPE